MPELAKTMTIRWSTDEPVEVVKQRCLEELDRMAVDRWGFLGFRRNSWQIRLSPDSARLIETLTRQVRLDTQLGNPGFVFPEDAEVWEAWAEYEEVNRWTTVEEGADRWTA